MEAERLELMAAKARLEFERAELTAERKRLELDKMRTMKEIQQATSAAASSDNTATTTATATSTTTTPSSTSTSTPTSTSSTPDAAPAKNKKDFKATIKVGSGPVKQVTAESLSDLLSAEFPRVTEKDIETIRQKLCGMDTFFVTEVDRSPFDERVVFRGNMRMDASKLLEELEKRAAKEGISERVRFFVLLDPKESPNDSDGERRPVLVALPSAATPNQTTPFSVVFSTVVAVAALFTSFSYGIGSFGLTPSVISQIAQGSTTEVFYTLPVSMGIMGITLAHDLGHRIMASFRNVKLGLPFFIPSLQIGTFGTITPFESYARLRRDLFDIAVSGPIVGIGTSLFALIYGLSATASDQVADWFPQVPTALFHVSLVVGALADVILPAAAQAQATLAVHPLVIVGYTGLIINALNLLPIGRLDGGRIIQALYGRVVGGRATAITILLQGFTSILGNSPLLLFWGLVCIFLQRESDFPCLNEVLEPDNSRTVLGLAIIAFALLVIIPFPDQAGNILGSL